MLFRAIRSFLKPPLAYSRLDDSLYSGLIAAYLFNEGGGPTLNDATGSSPVALSGSTFNWTTGAHGPAVNFNTLAIGAGVRTDALDPNTFSIWLKVNDVTTGQGVVNKSVDTGFFTAAPTTGWDIRVLTGSIQFQTVNGLVLDVNIPSANSWHHYVFYWDKTAAHSGGSSNSADSGAFVDGVPGLASASAGSGSYTSDSASPLRFAQIIPGAVAFGNTFPLLNGQIESFMAWNRILSGTEVRDLFAATYPALRSRYVYVPKAPTPQVLTASMANFAGALVAVKAKLSPLAASMLQFSGALVNAPGKVFSASMASFAGALITVHAATLKSLTATMSSFAATLIHQTSYQLTASMANFAGALALAVQHGGVPSTCIPAACPTIPNIISHVEVCENPGS